MKVFPAAMLLLAFWSVEWEPVLPDSIIHIGEFNRLIKATSVSGFRDPLVCAGLQAAATLLCN